MLKSGKSSRRILEHYDPGFTWSDAVLDHIVSRCTEVDSRARDVAKILTGTMLPQRSTEFLARIADGVKIKSVAAEISETETVFRFELSST